MFKRSSRIITCIASIYLWIENVLLKWMKKFMIMILTLVLLRHFLYHVLLKGGFVCTPPWIFFIKCPLPLCLLCIAMGLFFPLIPKSTIHPRMTSLWRHNTSGLSKLWKYFTITKQCTHSKNLQKIDFWLKIVNMPFSRDFWQNK